MVSTFRFLFVETGVRSRRPRGGGWFASVALGWAAICPDNWWYNPGGQGLTGQGYDLGQEICYETTMKSACYLAPAGSFRLFRTIAPGSFLTLSCAIICCIACTDAPQVAEGGAGAPAFGLGNVGGNGGQAGIAMAGQAGGMMLGAAGSGLGGASSGLAMAGAAGLPESGESDAGAATGLDAGVPAVAFVACPASAVFCEDFEDDTLGVFPGAPWSQSINGNGSIAVDATRTVSGSNAVRISVPGGSAYQRAYLQLSDEILPAVSTEMYGRAMMWLNETPDGEVHWTFIEAEGAVAGGTERLYRYGGQLQGGAGLMANYETRNVATDCWDHSASTMPTQQWVCVEWRFAVATNEMEFWLNGAALEDIHITGEGEGCLGDGLGGQWLAPPAFETLSLGWERYQAAGNDRDLWLDDIAISTERLGCAP